MPKQTVSAIIVTNEQFEYIQRTVARKAQMAEKVKGDKKLKELVLKFAQRTATPPEAVDTKTLRLATNRQELRYLEEVVTRERLSLLTTIIPNYQKRNLPTDIEYVERAEQKVEMLTELLSTIQQRLKRGSRD